jgi:aryl-alcohol dehydrogenase-like predicted oxidoreductase
MERRPIGNTDLMTSPIGFGTWEMSTTMYGSIDVGEASRAVHSAIDHGINLFDTAEVYGPFHSEELLAKALGARRREVILVTKTGFKFDDEKYRVLGRNSRYEHIIARTEGCLRRLNTDVIDLMLIHWPDFETPFDEPVRALQKLKEDGKIRHAGVSNFNIETMDYCRQYTDIAVNQVGYHLFDQRMQRAILPYCLQHNIGFMAYGTLAFGLLTGTLSADTTFGSNDWRATGGRPGWNVGVFAEEYFQRNLQVVEDLKPIAESRGKGMPHLALRWVLSNPAVSVALVGTRTAQEVEDNVAGLEWALSGADFQRIDAVFDRYGVDTHPEIVIDPDE